VLILPLGDHQASAFGTPDVSGVLIIVLDVAAACLGAFGAVGGLLVVTHNKVPFLLIVSMIQTHIYSCMTDLYAISSGNSNIPVPQRHIIGIEAVPVEISVVLPAPIERIASSW